MGRAAVASSAHHCAAVARAIWRLDRVLLPSRHDHDGAALFCSSSLSLICACFLSPLVPPAASATASLSFSLPLCACARFVRADTWVVGFADSGVLVDFCILCAVKSTSSPIQPHDRPEDAFEKARAIKVDIRPTSSSKPARSSSLTSVCERQLLRQFTPFAAAPDQLAAGWKRLRFRLSTRSTPPTLSSSARVARGCWLAAPTRSSRTSRASPLPG